MSDTIHSQEDSPKGIDGVRAELASSITSSIAEAEFLLKHAGSPKEAEALNEALANMAEASKIFEASNPQSSTDD